MILNLTSERTTPVQSDAGAVDLPDDVRQEVVNRLHVPGLATPEDLQGRAEALVTIALAYGEGASQIMVDAPPYLLIPLVTALAAAGLTPVHARTDWRGAHLGWMPLAPTSESPNAWWPDGLEQAG